MSKLICIRRFNDAGLRYFNSILVEKMIPGTKYVAADDLPEALLFDRDLTEPFVESVDIDLSVCATKYELGRRIVDALERRELKSMLADDKVWPWLSLAFKSTVMPERNGRHEVKDISRHILTSVGGRSREARYRHLVHGAVFNVFRFGENAKVLMTNPDGQCKIEENWMSRQVKMPLSMSIEIVRAMRQMYIDPEKDAHKHGAISGKKGSAIRLLDVLRQLEVNYDIASFTAEELIGVLPAREFGKYLPKAA